MPIAKVALDVPLPRLFDYRSDSLDASHVGARVVVPFGGTGSAKQGRSRVGVIMEVTDQSEIAPERIRAIDRVLDDTPRLPAKWLSMVNFCAGYYQKPIGEVLMSAVSYTHLRAHET